MSRPRGYEERHYDVMLIAFHAINVSEHRPKPEFAAVEARIRADAFVAELVKMDLEREAEESALARGMGGDLTHENAARDTEPPQGDSADAAALADLQREQDERLAAQKAETDALSKELAQTREKQ